MISPEQRPLPDNTWHSPETDISAAVGIQTCNPSKWAVIDLHLRLRGHWDQLSNSILNNIVDSASPCLKLLSVSDTSVTCPSVFTVPFESCNIILIEFTNFFFVEGIQNSFKFSHKYILFTESYASLKSVNNKCKSRLNSYHFVRMHLNNINY